MRALTGTTSAIVRVCSSTVGMTGSGTARKASCASYGGTGTFTGPDADPEAPLFVLHRVDIEYTVTPLINAGPLFGAIGTTVLPTYTFHRQVSMRQM
jgi:hypothetical protein